MKTSDFDFHLPPDSIAQHPAEPRDASRLLVMDRSSGSLTHKYFRDLVDYIRPGDLLVINRSRVVPARLFARKAATGGKVELLLLERVDALRWKALVGGKGLGGGAQLVLENDIEAEIVQELEGSQRLVSFSRPIDEDLNSLGSVPLPPYIHAPLADPERYQTVYGVDPGSAAAPTAGLHFTPELMRQLEALGARFAEVTLHIGLDTFAPVKENDPQEHHIHTEWCQLTNETAEIINETRRKGGRVIAIGTTAVRVLETAGRNTQLGDVKPYEGRTDLFILPGFDFRVVDAMLTNFHLPQSTLLMLVSAFAGRERVLAAYEKAITQGYRFYSFGDAMLIL